jgi:hypothetical protein
VFARTKIQFADRWVDVFVVPHPSAGYGKEWKDTYPLVVEELRQRAAKTR